LKEDLLKFLNKTGNKNTHVIYRDICNYEV
jgi:hypothetical protein